MPFSILKAWARFKLFQRHKGCRQCNACTPNWWRIKSSKQETLTVTKVSDLEEILENSTGTSIQFQFQFHYCKWHTSYTCSTCYGEQYKQRYRKKWMVSTYKTCRLRTNSYVDRVISIWRMTISLLENTHKNNTHSWITCILK